MSTTPSAHAAMPSSARRSLDELKAETRRRADRNLPPLSGVDPADAAAALAMIDSLDRDAWARAWIEVGDRFLAQARQAEPTEPVRARAYYHRAWHNFNMGRWPTENSSAKRTSYERALEAFAAFARLLDPPIETLKIGFEGSEIFAYLRLPPAVRPAPLVIAIAGLDSRKEDIGANSDQYIQAGVGMVALDMPGTGQAPLKVDVGSERMFSTVIDHLGKRNDIDAARIVVQGRSWSGYFAAVLAYSEKKRIRGAVMHGGPIHAYFQREWQEKGLDTREYLFDLFEARSAIYPGIETREQFFAFAPRLSLLARGLIDRPSAPMLLVNGARDTQVPIEDLYLLMGHGTPKEAWVNPTGGHMGRSADFTSPMIARQVVMPWILRALRGEVPIAQD